MNTTQIQHCKKLADALFAKKGAAELAALKEAIAELELKDPNEMARALVPLMGKRLHIMLTRGVQCIGADGVPLFDGEGEPLYKEASESAIREARQYCERHGAIVPENNDPMAKAMLDKAKSNSETEPMSIEQLAETINGEDLNRADD